MSRNINYRFINSRGFFKKKKHQQLLFFFFSFSNTLCISKIFFRLLTGWTKELLKAGEEKYKLASEKKDIFQAHSIFPFLVILRFSNQLPFGICFFFNTGLLILTWNYDIKVCVCFAIPLMIQNLVNKIRNFKRLFCCPDLIFSSRVCLGKMMLFTT